MSRSRTLFEIRPATEVVKTWALTDETGRYCYRLWRVWDTEKPRLVWVLLAASQTDAMLDDLTTATCRRFAEQWGFGAIDIVYLFSYRVSSPETDLAAARKSGIDIVGTDTDKHLEEALRTAGAAVAAWGSNRMALERSQAVLAKLYSRGAVHCLGLTREGAPKHPLCLRWNSKGRMVPIPAGGRVASPPEVALAAR